MGKRTLFGLLVEIIGNQEERCNKCKSDVHRVDNNSRLKTLAPHLKSIIICLRSIRSLSSYKNDNVIFEFFPVAFFYITLKSS